MSANAAVNMATGATKAPRATLLFVILSTLVWIINVIAVTKIPKKERKGLGFGAIVISIIVGILSMMYNFWIYARETGIAALAKSQGQTLAARFQQKISGGGPAVVAAGATNVGQMAV